MNYYASPRDGAAPYPAKRFVPNMIIYQDLSIHVARYNNYIPSYILTYTVQTFRCNIVHARLALLKMLLYF